MAELSLSWPLAGVGRGEGRVDERGRLGGRRDKRRRRRREAAAADSVVVRGSGRSGPSVRPSLLFFSSFFSLLVPVPVPLDDVEDGVSGSKQPDRREGGVGGGRRRGSRGDRLAAAGGGAGAPLAPAARRRRRRSRGERPEEPRRGVPHAGLGVPQQRAGRRDQGGERLGAPLAARRRHPPPIFTTSVGRRGRGGGGDRLRQRGPAEPPVPRRALTFFFAVIIVRDSHLVERVRSQGVEERRELVGRGGCGCACLCFDLSEKGVEKEEKKASRKMMIVQFDVFLPSFFPI